MAATFTARYDGYCRVCLRDFPAGEQVAYNEHDELCCQDCIHDEEGEARVVETQDAPSSGWKNKRRKA